MKDPLSLIGAGTTIKRGDVFMDYINWRTTKNEGLPPEKQEILCTIRPSFKTVDYNVVIIGYYFHNNPRDDVMSFHHSWRGEGLYEYIDDYDPFYRFVCGADKIVAWAKLRPYEEEIVI